MSQFDTFEDRYDYLALKGEVGKSTFGFDRYINQRFYSSRQWKQVRQHVIARDLACDMGVEGYDIHDKIYIHHMNPMLSGDITGDDASILNPEFLVCVTHKTHNAIHFGDKRQLPRPLAARRPGDTKLW